MKSTPFIFSVAILFLAQSCHQKEKHSSITPPAPKIVKVIPVKTSPDSISITAVGDIMLGTSYPNSSTLPPDSGKNSFKMAEQYLKQTDVTFGNLEGTLSDNASPAFYKTHLKTKAYLFKMPEYYGSLLKNSGFNLMSVANNHSGDFGDPGRQSTTKVLDSCGIHYAGLLEYPSVIFEVKGIKYGFCSFAPNAHTVSIFDLKNAGRIISDMKQQCDIVIVSFHGGAEGAKFEHVSKTPESYSGEKRGNVYAFAHNAIDNGADLIFGNGPHVSRAMELYKNRLIAYSLGNFCTYKCVSIEGVCGIAPLLKVYVNKKGEFIKGRIVSFKQNHLTGLKPDSLNSAAIKIKALTESDFPQSGLNISTNGLIAPQSGS